MVFNPWVFELIADRLAAARASLAT